MTALFTIPRQVPLSAGTILPGAKLYFYQTTTSTPQNTYQDAALTTPHANPVVADANGVFAAIYLSPALPDYRATLTTSADVVLYTQDGVPANIGTQQSMRFEATNPFILLYDTDGTANQRKVRIRVNGNAFEIAAANDAENTFANILSYASGVLNVGGPASAVTIDGVGVATAQNGSFTATLTGMTGATTGTINYHRTGNVIILYANTAITGTSNTTSMTMTGLPAIVRPAADRTAPCGRLTDTGNTSLFGEATVSSAGVITFAINKTNAVANFVQSSSTAFTNSGTKGLTAQWSLVYAQQ